MMRLTCPNCAAQYEVEDDVIPPEGRDVQCSNCGHTWFQTSAKAPKDEPADIQADEPEQEDALEDTGNGEAQPAARRQVMDDDVTSVLREEAERERAERLADRESGLEMQTEMGLDNRAEETSPNLSETAGIVEEEIGTTVSGMVAATAKRKDMLPDIEEINSSLTPQVEEDEDDANETTAPARSSGFRRGFLLVIVIFVIMAAVYLLAPRIADQFPQTADSLAAYVDWVNGLSASLNGLMADITERVSTLLGAMNSDS